MSRATKLSKEFVMFSELLRVELFERWARSANATI